jgi:hypothetical protein
MPTALQSLHLSVNDRDGWAVRFRFRVRVKLQLIAEQHLHPIRVRVRAGCTFLVL